MDKPQADFGRVLLVSRTNDHQLQTLIDAILPNVALVRCTSNLPALGQFESVLLEGDQSSLALEEVENLTGYVENGGQVLAIDAAASAPTAPIAMLLGCFAQERLPKGEFFGHMVPSDADFGRNLRPEFPFIDGFAALQGLSDDARALIETSVHFRNRVVAIERPLGLGRVVTSALGASPEAYSSPELRTFLRRGLRRRNEGPADRRVRIAIVGFGPLGGMGHVHALAVQQTEGLELVAVCDSNKARLESAIADFPDVRAYGSVEEVSHDPEVDVAIVATPPSSHTTLVRLLLDAGKSVICEKPLCFSLDEANDLFDTALARGLMLTVNQNRRWDADYLTVRHAIETDMLGDVFNVETFVGSFEHPCREWHSEASISGGAEFDWGAHYIDWTLQIMGGSSPASVSANGHKRVWHDVTNLDQVRVRMLWEDGREAEFLHSDVAGVRRPKFYIQGTKGTLVGHYRPLISERIVPGRGFVREESHHAEAPAELTLARYEPLGVGLREQRLSLVDSQPLAFYRNIADHLIFGDEPLAVDDVSARRLISVLEAAHKSAESGGRPIKPA